jgi:hypothetical protein
LNNGTKHGNFEEKIPNISILPNGKNSSQIFFAAENPKKEKENHNYPSHPITY